jgi:hypothetical protein
LILASELVLKATQEEDGGFCAEVNPFISLYEG